MLQEVRHGTQFCCRHVGAAPRARAVPAQGRSRSEDQPGLAFVCRACDYYGVSADFLLGRAPSPTCTPEQLEALRVLVQDVRTAADRAGAALEEIAL